MRRLHWIDNLKIMAMFLVILSHLPISEKWLCYIYVFHVPVFFCVSGFLYKKVNFKEELRKCFTRLIIPYLFFQILFCLVLYTDYQTLIRHLLGTLIGENYRTELFASPCIPLWFLISLVLIRLIRSVTNKWGCLILLCFTILLSYIFKNGIQSIWSVDTALLCLPFFYLGEIINHKKLYNYSNKWLYLLLLVLLLSFNVWYCRSSEQMIDAASFRFGNSIILYYLFNCSINLCFLGVFANFISIKIPVFERLNEGMILLLACHAFICRIIMKIFSLQTDMLPIGVAIGTAILSLLVMYPIIFIVKKHANFVLGK